MINTMIITALIAVSVYQKRKINGLKQEIRITNEMIKRDTEVARKRFSELKGRLRNGL